MCFSTPYELLHCWTIIPAGSTFSKLQTHFSTCSYSKYNKVQDIGGINPWSVGEACLPRARMYEITVTAATGKGQKHLFSLYCIFLYIMLWQHIPTMGLVHNYLGTTQCHRCQLFSSIKQRYIILKKCSQKKMSFPLTFLIVSPRLVFIGWTYI